jgi:hypothetical protein
MLDKRARNGQPSPLLELLVLPLELGMPLVRLTHNLFQLFLLSLLVLDERAEAVRVCRVEPVARDVPAWRAEFQGSGVRGWYFGM